MGSISLRKSIRWLPDEASEPTSTVVLTSPSRRFVDIRVLIPENAKGPWPTKEETLSPDQLDWAIAGTSSSWKDDADGVTRGQWRHWIDSRTIQTEGLADEGDMHSQPDGTTLEKGTMVNPATGKDTAYEEVWSDPEPIATSETGVRSVVLQLDEDSHNRGMVVLVGQYCQGFLRRGDKIILERWEWSGEDGWRRTVVLGDHTLPCSDILEATSLQEGQVVQVGHDVWQVTESFTSQS